MTKHVHERMDSSHTVVRAMLALGISALLSAPAASWGAALTCLTGADPSVAGDLTQIAAVRAAIDSACLCASFDGSKAGGTHGAYVKCVKGVIAASVTAGELRKQCKRTVTKYYSASTCGFPASQARQPCIKVSNGKVTCAIKPAAKCVQPQVPCAGFSTCIDGSDTNHDGIIGVGDSGSCVPPFVDNGDGTITDNRTRLMWEKKDQAGGLHDVNTLYNWAGVCSGSQQSCFQSFSSCVFCQPTQNAASACSTETGNTTACDLCGQTQGTCNRNPFPSGFFNAANTIWDWLAQLNASNFAGHNDWRIPTTGICPDGQAPELESIAANPLESVFDTACTPGCSVNNCSCTRTVDLVSGNPYALYWTATLYPDGTHVCLVGFPGGAGSAPVTTFGYDIYVRAVRGGS